MDIGRDKDNVGSVKLCALPAGGNLCAMPQQCSGGALGGPEGLVASSMKVQRRPVIVRASTFPVRKDHSKASLFPKRPGTTHGMRQRKVTQGVINKVESPSKSSTSTSDWTRRPSTSEPRQRLHRRSVQALHAQHQKPNKVATTQGKSEQRLGKATRTLPSSRPLRVARRARRSMDERSSDEDARRVRESTRQFLEEKLRSKEDQRRLIYAKNALLKRWNRVAETRVDIPPAPV